MRLRGFGFLDHNPKLSAQRSGVKKEVALHITRHDDPTLNILRQIILTQRGHGIVDIPGVKSSHADAVRPTRASHEANPYCAAARCLSRKRPSLGLTPEQFLGLTLELIEIETQGQRRTRHDGELSEGSAR